MPYIVFAGQTTPISASRLVELKDELLAASKAGEPLEISVVDADGAASWLLWTPGAPVILNDGDVPPVPEFTFPDFSSMGLPGFPEPPTPPRRVGF